MKRNLKRLPALLLAIILCLSLLPVTAWAANFPSNFYAALMNHSGMGTVNSSLTYTSRNTETQQVYGMEYAGGVFFTVEGKGSDDGFRELRMYNSSLTNYRTIGTVNNVNGDYWIVDTAMDLSDEEPALYGTYNGYAFIGGEWGYYSYICKISLTNGTPSDPVIVTGLSSTSDIIYAIAFDEDGTLYAIGADAGDNGGPATLYTIDLENVQTGTFGSQTVSATEVAEITTSSGKPISTNYIQDLAFDHATGTLYWAENDNNVLYTVNTTNAVATKVGQVKSSGKVYPIQSFCIPYDTAFGQADDQYMISVICEGAGEVTCNDENKPFYLVNSGEDITLTIEFNTGGVDDNLLGVTVDGKTVSISSLVDNSYTFENVTGNHVIEVKLKKEIPATQKTVTWLHYQGEPASFYTVDNVYKFYDLPYLDKEVPREDYVQTLLDEEGKPIDDDEIILPGSYDVHVTHPGNADYAAMDVIYTDALVLGKCPGTPGRPVVYGKVGCTQGDLTTTSALQDYYGSDGELIDSAHDEIPVTLVWLSPETRYDTAGNFYASATIHAADNLDQRLKDCYDLDDGKPLTEGCLISSRATQVVVLPADEASIIKLQTSDASGGTVSGKGVYKNGDEVTVTATVNSDDGYEFKGWQENGETVSENLTYEFKADGDRTLTALFETDPEYRVTLQADPQDGGTVTGGGNYKEDGHNATVKATPNQGYYFIGWYEAGNDTAVSTDASYEVNVPEDGIALTAKFGIDYLARAEQAQTNFASAVSTDAFEWQTLVQAVETYETAEEFVKNPPSVIQNAGERYAALTTYYNNVDTLDLSAQNISSADLAKLDLFTGVTDLNLSGNKNVTSLSNLANMTQLETLDLSGTGVTDLTALKDLTALDTLDISNTGMTVLDSLITVDKPSFPGCKTLTAKNLTLNSLSALEKLVSAEDFNADSVTQWDFSGSTLTDSEENKADVKAIQDVLGDRFTPPTIKTTPTGGGGGGATTYAVTVEKAEHGKVTASPTQAGSGSTVTLTVKPDAGYVLDTLTATDAKGNEVKLTDKGNGTYTFTMPDSKVEIAASFKESAEQAANPFTDVRESDYYYDAVLWAVENGVTNGTSAATFSPNAAVTRAQMVTFLWRAYGSPKATGSNPFADVRESEYYYDAVLWAVENGVTNGTSATTFSPGAPVTRAQSVTFQWRAAGSPAAAGDSFDDVAADAYYAGAVTWAAATGVTNGTSSSKFSPDMAVSRAQAVTFLYRELA